MFEIIKNFFSSFRNFRDKKQRILIIESRYKTVQFLERTLSKRYLLLIAQDKEEALKKVISEKADLIVLNSKLNKGRTLDLCNAIRSSDQTSRLPILIIAENGDDSKIAEFYAQKIEGYLIEPFTKKDILGQVQLSLNSKKG